jgi:hypothetical protein
VFNLSVTPMLKSLIAVTKKELESDEITEERRASLQADLAKWEEAIKLRKLHDLLNN